MIEFDCRELEAYARELQKCPERLEKKTRTFLQREGTKLRNRITTKAKKAVKPHVKPRHVTDKRKYAESFQRGKVYQYRDVDAVRVFNSTRHAHLIESGHDVYKPGPKKGGKKLGHAEGRHPMQKAVAAYEPVFERNCEKLIDEVVKGL